VAVDVVVVDGEISPLAVDYCCCCCIVLTCL
jgi:hypothetical protein